MVILRINRSIRWKCWTLTVLCLGCLLSVTAWFVSVPYTSTIPSLLTKRNYLDVGNSRRNFDSSIQATRKANDDEKRSDGEKKKKNKDNKKGGGVDSSSEDSTGIFRFITKRFKKEAKQAKKQAELEKKLNKILNQEENDDDTAKFDFSIADTLLGIEQQLITARDELRSVRATREPPSEEEIRLEALRTRARMERARRLRALEKIEKPPVSSASLREAEDTKREDKQQSPNPDGRRTKTVARKGEDKSRGESDDSDSSRSKNRSNPLSVAQKFVSGVFEKQVEEWIPVAPKTRISPGEIVPISAAGLDLLLVASKDGSALHCIANSCPHLGTPLEVGMLERRPIETTPEQQQAGPEIASVGLREVDIANLLAQDGCEDCIVCPLHRTAFALESGEVRGEWCPYPPVIGKVVGTVKTKATLPVFDVRTRGKNIEVRLNTPFKGINE